MKPATKCRICQNSGNSQLYCVTEMMFGYQDSFTYFQCSNCGCLQISQFPEEISKYYPPNYSSFSQMTKQKKFYKLFLKRKLFDYAIFKKDLLGRILAQKYSFDKRLSSLSEININKESSILDVGCGTGKLLLSLKIAGFKKLCGIDPFIANSIIYENNLIIEKKFLHEMDGQWDLIMFHHSFEHIPDPIDTMKCVSRLLSPKGVCLIRIPTTSSYAWEHYKENWVQLDAPRHLFLHSLQSMELVAIAGNLHIEKVIYDSGTFQFWGSEQYLRNIPLLSEQSYLVNAEKSPFSENDIHVFKIKAERLNEEKRGDQAAFYLRKRER